jgi:hypothetical protein
MGELSANRLPAVPARIVGYRRSDHLFAWEVRDWTLTAEIIDLLR